MAINVGNVYFDALVRTKALEDKLSEIERKRQQLQFDAMLNAGNVLQSADRIANQKRNIHFKGMFDGRGLRSDITKAVSDLGGQTVNIAGKVTVTGLGTTSDQFKVLSVALGNSLSDAFSQSLDILLSGIKSAGNLIAGFSVDSIESFGSLEATLNEIQVKSRASDAAIQGLQSTITSIAATSPSDVKSLATLSTTLVQAGRSIADVENLLRPIGTGSAGLNISADRLAGTTALLLDSFGLAADQGSKVVDAITATTIAANTNAQQLSEAFKNFRSQKRDIEGLQASLDVLALSAAAGFQGGRAGSQANRLFVQAIKNADDVVRDFGVRVKDQNGQLRSELDILLELRQAYNRVASEQGSARAVELANKNFQTQGARTLTGISALADSVISETLRKSQAATREGATFIDALGEQALKGTKGAAVQLGNSLQSAQVILGSSIAPIAESIARSASVVINAITENEGILTRIGDAAARFRDVLSSPAVIETLKQVGSILGGLIGEGLDYAASLVNSISSKLAASPEILQSVAQWVAAIVKDIASIVAFVVEIGIQIGSALSRLISVQGVLGVLRTGITEVLGLANTFFVALTRGLNQGQLSVLTLQSGIRTVGSLLQPVAALFGGIYGSIIAIASETLKIVNESGLVLFTASLTKNITSLFGQIQSSVPQIVRTIGTAFTSFSSGLSQGIGSVNLDSPNIQSPQLNIADVARNFGETLGEVGARIFNIVSRISEIVANNIVPALLKVGEALAPVANSLLTTVFDLVTKLVPLIEKIINLTIGFINDNLPGLQQFRLQAVDLIGKISGFVVGIIAQLVNAVTQSETIKTLWASITTFVGQLLTNAKSIFETVTTNLQSLDGVRSLVSSIAGFVGKVTFGVLNISTNLARASASVSGIQSGFSAIVGFIDEQTGKFGSFFDSITKVVEKLEFFPKLGHSAETIFGNLSAGLNAFITTFTEKARPALDPVFKAIEENSPKILNLILKLGEWAAQFSVVFAPVAEFVATVLANAVILAGKLLTHLIGTVGKVAEFISTNERIQEIINFVTNAVGFLFRTLTSVSNTITGIQGQVIDTIYPVLEFVTLGLLRIADVVSNIGFNLLKGIASTFTNIGQWFLDQYKWLTETFVPWLSGFWAQLQTKWNEFSASVVLWIQETIVKRVIELRDRLFLLWQSWLDKWDNFTSAIGKFFTEEIPNTITDFRDWVFGIWQSWVDKWNSFTTAISKYFAEGIREQVSGFRDWVFEVWQSWVDKWNNFTTRIGKYFSEGIRKTLTEFRDWAFETWQSWVDKWNAFVSQITKFFTEDAIKAIQGLIDWWYKKWEEFTKKIEEFKNGLIRFIFDTLPKKVSEAVAKALEFLQPVLDFFNVKIPNSLNTIGKGIDSIADNNVPKLNSALSGMLNVANNIGKSISNWSTQATAAVQALSGNVGGAVGTLVTGGGTNEQALKTVRSLFTTSPKLGNNENIFYDAGFSKTLIELIKRTEGFYSKPYWDYQQWTSGFGTKARNSTESIGVEEANRRLLTELQSARNQAKSLLNKYGIKYTNNMLDALTSFTYNGGIGMTDMLLQYGKRTDINTIAEYMLRYNKATDVSGRVDTLPGLTKRRKAEQALFLSPDTQTGQAVLNGVTSITDALQGKNGGILGLVNNLNNSVGKIQLESYKFNTIPAQAYLASRGGGTRRHLGQDFDIDDRTGSFRSILGGEVIHVGYNPGGYYKYLDIYNKNLGVVERIAELNQLYYKKGDVVPAGALAGGKGTPTGVVHVEYRNIEDYRQNAFAGGKTINPIEYLKGLGLYRVEDTPGLGLSIIPTGKTITQQVRRPQAGGISDELAARSLEATEQIIQALGTINLEPVTHEHTHEFPEVRTTRESDALLAQHRASYHAGEGLAEALALAPTTTGTSNTIFAQIFEVLQQISDRLTSVMQFTSMASSYISQIAEAVEQTRNSLRSKLEISLAPNDDQNFNLLNSVRQILYATKFSGNNLDQYLAANENQQSTTPGTSSSQSQSGNNQQYTFSEAINRIAEYSKLIYEVMGQKLGFVTYDSNDGNVPRFNTSDSSTPLVEAVNRIDNKLSEWYESVMSYFNNITGTNTNAVATAQADAGLVAGVNNLVEVLDRFYRIIEEKQQRMADYYQAEGLDASSVPALQAVEAVLGATSLALKDSDYSNLLANTPEGFAITLHTKPLAGITVPTTRDLNLNITTHLATIAGNQVEVATMPEVRRLLQEAKAQITNERHDEMYDPRYTSEISLASLESLRRDSGLRSVILG